MSLKEKILIIEDDKILTSTLKEILTAEGYLVDIAHNALTAQTLMPSTHLALIDLRLPDKSGIQLLQELKQVNSQAEALIITGHADMKSAIDALNLGAFSYLEKPVLPEKLLHYIKRALEKRRLIMDVLRREQEIKGLTGMTGEILNDRVRLLEEAKSKEEQLSRLYRGISMAFRSLEPLQSARELLPLLAEITEANFIALILVDKDHKILERTGYFREMKPFEMEARRGGTRDEVLRTGKPIIIPDWLKNPDPNPALLAAGIKSTATYPLIVNGIIYALLFLHSLKEDNFTKYKEIIASFADLFAIPLYHTVIDGERDSIGRELEAVFDEINAGIAIVDKNRIIIRTNKAFAEMVKKPVTELAGKKICQLVHGNTESLLDCPVEKSMRTMDSSQVTIQESFLGIKNLEMRSVPVRAKNGETHRFVHIFRNLESHHKD